MKNLLFGLFALSVVLQSCEKSGGEEDVTNNVSEQTQKEFRKRFPMAEDVTWSSKGDYLIANFKDAATRSTATDTKAWFDNSAAWYMSEIDIIYTQLPQAVKDAFTKSQYSSWLVDDIDLIKRNGVDVVYVIETENQANEVDLYYSEDGVLIKTLIDSDNDYDYEDYIPSPITSSIEEYIKTNYPNSKVMEIDKEDGYTEIEIIDGKIKRDLVFDSNNRWLHTKTEVTTLQLPTQIITALNSSKYAAYKIDDIDHYKKSNKEFYRFELKSSNGDIKIDISIDGIITPVEYDPSSDNEHKPNVDTTIEEFIAKQYQGSKIIDIENEKGYIEVDIIHQNKEKTVRFNAANTWINTEWDIRLNEIPQLVKDAITTSKYASYKIDDIEFHQTSTTNYYEIELESGNNEIKLHINESGVIL